MSTSSLPYFSVIIAGAGPTGLAMGNLLGMFGIDALILEQNAGLSDCPKAIAMDDEGLRVCQAMGLHHSVIEHLLYDIDAHYISGNYYLARVAPTSKRNGFSLISTFHQPTLETIFCNGLQRFPGVALQFQHTVETFEQTGESVIVTVRAPGNVVKRIECAYLLACDGGKSGIRRALNIPMLGSTYAQKWLVIDTLDDRDPSPIAKFFCNPSRPAVTVPAPDSARRWEFMLLPGEQEAEMLQQERIHSLIRQVGGPSNPHIARSAIYTFHASLAAHFSQGRVFLLGDAAHMLPPFGGQGLNCGLRDAHNLSWKLRLVLQGLAAPALLSTYSIERSAHTAQMIQLSTFLGNIVMSTSKPLAFLRDSIFHTINTIPAVRNHFTEARIKPQPRYKKGLMLADNTRESKAMTGTMLPQPEISTTEGNKTLLDNALGPGFALLCLHDDPQRAFASLKADIWRRLDVRFVAISCRDTLHRVHDFPLKRQKLFVLVRPDRYILGVFQEHQAEMFAARLQRYLAAFPRSSFPHNADHYHTNPDDAEK